MATQKPVLSILPGAGYPLQPSVPMALARGLDVSLKADRDG